MSPKLLLQAIVLLILTAAAGCAVSAQSQSTGTIQPPPLTREAAYRITPPAMIIGRAKEGDRFVTSQMVRCTMTRSQDTRPSVYDQRPTLILTPTPAPQVTQRIEAAVEPGTGYFILNTGSIGRRQKVELSHCTIGNKPSRWLQGDEPGILTSGEVKYDLTLEVIPRDERGDEEPLPTLLPTATPYPSATPVQPTATPGPSATPVQPTATPGEGEDASAGENRERTPRPEVEATKQQMTVLGTPEARVTVVLGTPEARVTVVPEPSGPPSPWYHPPSTPTPMPTSVPVPAQPQELPTATPGPARGAVPTEIPATQLPFIQGGMARDPTRASPQATLAGPQAPLTEPTPTPAPTPTHTPEPTATPEPTPTSTPELSPAAEPTLGLPDRGEDTLTTDGTEDEGVRGTYLLAVAAMVLLSVAAAAGGYWYVRRRGRREGTKSDGD